MNENTKTDFGEIRIHDNVIATIAMEATKQIPGVLKIGGSLKTLLFELFGKKDTTAIKIEFDKDSETTITIPVVVKYGYNIPDIASKVQENVKIAIESATNISIREVNVKIQEIEKTTSSDKKS